MAEGKYYIRVALLDYWNLKEFESLWFFFVDRGYKLSIAGISDFVKASELYLNKGFLNVAIYWGDAS